MNVKELIFFGSRYDKKNLSTEEVNIYQNPKIFDFFSSNEKKIYSLRTNLIEEEYPQFLKLYTCTFNNDFHLISLKLAQTNEIFYFNLIDPILDQLACDLKAVDLIKYSGKISKIGHCLIDVFKGENAMPHYVHQIVDTNGSFGLELKDGKNRIIHLNIFPKTMLIDSHNQNDYKFLSDIQKRIEHLFDVYSIMHGKAPDYGLENKKWSEYTESQKLFVSKRKNEILIETFLSKEITFIGQIVKRNPSGIDINISCLILNKRVKIVKRKPLSDFTS